MSAFQPDWMDAHRGCMGINGTHWPDGRCKVMMESAAFLHGWRCALDAIMVKHYAPADSDWKEDIVPAFNLLVSLGAKPMASEPLPENRLDWRRGYAFANLAAQIVLANNMRNCPARDRLLLTCRDYADTFIGATGPA